MLEGSYQFTGDSTVAREGNSRVVSVVGESSSAAERFGQTSPWDTGFRLGLDGL